MAEAIPNRSPQRNGTSGKHHSLTSHHHGNGSQGSPVNPLPRAAGQEALTGEELLFEELSPRGEENHDLLGVFGADLGSDPAASQPGEAVERLHAENEELRCTLADLQEQLEAVSRGPGQGWEEREREYDALLEEKSEVIRDLHRKLQEFQDHPTSRTGSRPPNEDELQAVCDELERERSQLDNERRHLEQDRAQLKEDEESLMKQMREMEMAMSRERAELARQRNELHRLHNDVKHELELAARDATLRDRLVSLQRRHQDIANRKGSSPTPEQHATPAPAPAPPPPPAKKESGILRRLFGSGQ
jgi:DNA repair exonuclease SbcCD ATPase subunit